ncbi:MAG: TMEM164 family acyltransferase [Acidimicrobiales bacterium]
MASSPRRGAVTRVFAITVAFTAVAGAVDWASGADYMLLAGPPPTFSLLQLFGPWPWYLVGATGLAVLSLLVLDAPFRMARRRAAPDRWRGRARS